MKKKLLIAVLALLVILAAGAAVFFSGILIRPTAAQLSGYTPVKSFDVLAFQNQREQDILKDYQADTYTLEKPYIIQDPYQANPLSALVLFETAQPATAQVTVPGKDEYTTFSYTYAEPKTHHEVAVLGLYPNAETKVRITVKSEGSPDQIKELSLKTEGLPTDFPNRKVQVAKPELMEPGVNLMIPCFETNYTYLLDARGEVRAYFTNKNFGHGTAMRLLQNGRLLATGDVMKIMPYNMYTVWEMNLLGKIFTEYDIPNAVHHDIMEMANGDFLATSSNKDMPNKYHTREDVVIQINRQTGKVTGEYDIRKILDERREPYNHFDPGIQNVPNRDWAHMNSVEYDLSDDSLIISSPIQSAVVKFDRKTSAIRWMLSSPEGWDGEFSKYQPYLLKPVGGDNFEWQWGQHAAKILPDSDNNPDTLDLLMFDNGQARSTTEANSIKPENNYSRAVIYRIDQKKMTVEQLWQYGKERGSEAYSTFLGSADFLPKTGNVNISFGGMLRENGIPVDDIVKGVLGQQEVWSRVVETRPSGEPVFDVLVTPNHTSSAETYQSRRIDLYTAGIDYALGQEKGQRKGEIQSNDQIEMTVPKFFINRFKLNFNQLFEKDGYLIAQGNFQYQDKTYLIGRVNLVLQSQTRRYIFQGGPGINGNFYSRIDLHKLEPGEYAIHVIGAVIDGNDASSTDIKPGFNPTGYKIIVK